MGAESGIRDSAYAASKNGSVVEAVTGATSSLASSGAITVSATGTSTADANSDLGSAGLGISLGANLPTAIALRTFRGANVERARADA